MPDARPPGQQPEIPRDVQSEIRRQIDDIVERYGGRRPRRTRISNPVPSPAEATEPPRVETRG